MRFTALALVFLISLFSSSAVYANNRIGKQLIDVTLHKDGSASIKETRTAVLEEGTENFIVIGNLGKSEIKDFTVKENGKPYQYVKNWDSSASREQKANKNGIIETGDGYELCWGVGTYGKHAYTIEYKVTNFIKQLTDSQMVFWRFVNDDMDPAPEHVKVTIKGSGPFSADQEKIWSFGYKGKIEFRDGQIVAESSQALDAGNYVTVLAQFPDGMFQTADRLDKSFAQIKEQAFDGSDYRTEEDGSNIGAEEEEEGGSDIVAEEEEEDSSLFWLIPLAPLSFAAVVVGIIFLARKSGKPRAFKSKYAGEYFYVEPYKGNPADVYDLMNKAGISRMEQLLTSFILKWIQEERISVDQEEAGLVKKREAAVLRFLEKTSGAEKESPEADLFQFMLEAAGTDGVLQEKEFTRWARKHSTKLHNWEVKVKKHSQKKLEQDGFVTITEKKTFFLTKRDVQLTEEGKELEKQIYQFANYLQDYSLLNERDAVNVKIWDQLMIWAAMFGITEEVSKQFKNLYPSYVNESLYSDRTLLLTTMLATRVSDAQTAGQTNSSSGGGGGFSSMGGGGGSFGGGSGGGVR